MLKFTPKNVRLENTPAAPIGRARNALANVPIDAIVAIVGLRPGKNTVGNTSAAAVP
jgi:hypothetical protein